MHKGSHWLNYLVIRSINHMVVQHAVCIRVYTSEDLECVQLHPAVSVALCISASGCIAEQACIWMLTASMRSCTASKNSKLIQWGMQGLVMQCCIATSCPMKMKGA